MKLLQRDWVHGILLNSWEPLLNINSSFFISVPLVNMVRDLIEYQNNADIEQFLAIMLFWKGDDYMWNQKGCVLDSWKLLFPGKS